MERPVKKYPEHDLHTLGHNQACEKWEKFIPTETELHLIYYKATGVQISLSIANGLNAIYKRLKGIK